MNKLPNAEILKEIAIEMNIEPSFVEKDWYVVQALNVVSQLNNENFCYIFSGGTCLSKAHKLIKRFSEDIDFKVCSATPITKAIIKDARERLKTAILSLGFFHIDNEQSFDNSTLYRLDISYPKLFDTAASLRTAIRIEVKFQPPSSPAESKGIESFCAHYLNQPEEAVIDCVTPAETAVDKLSALIWRINIKDRSKPIGSKENDPTIIRHLHDIAALVKYMNGDSFAIQVKNTLIKDTERIGSDIDTSLQAMANNAIGKLHTDKEYEKEYNNFVNAVSYAPDNEIPTFQAARKIFEEIARHIFIPDKRTSTQSQ